MKKIIMAAVAVVLAVALGMAFTQKNTAPSAAFTALDGRQTSTEALKGKVVLVNFWATSCSGCINEMPDLIKTHQQYAPQGYETVAVAMSYDPIDFVQAYTSKNNLPFFVTQDKDGSLAKNFGEVRLTPTSILIAKDGTIIKRFLGEPDFKELHQLIETALKA